MSGKRRSGTIAFLMMVMLAVAMLLMIAGTAYADIVASDNCGTCKRSIDSYGRFVLEPQTGDCGVLDGWMLSGGVPPWFDVRSQIKSVQFKGTVKASSFINQMFYYCNNLTAVDFSGFDTTDVTHMSGMFDGCTSLKTIDLSGLNTSRLEDIDAMFESCSSLTSVDFSDFDTSRVTGLDHLFMSCYSLTSIDLSDLNTSSVSTMQAMFHGCENLTFIDLSSFNTASVKAMTNMFAGCKALQTIVVGDSWSTDKITSAAGDANMFYKCTNLVGGNGTTFDPDHINKDYARVDNPPDAPGYLTHVKTIVHPVTVTVEGGGTASASPESGTMDTEVELTAEPDTGWHFKEWKVVSVGVTIDENNKFTIGKKDVEVKAVFEKCSGFCEEMKEVKATCTKDGTKAYWTCKTCGKMYSDKDCTTVITKPEVLPKGHKLEKVDEVKATCTKDGAKAYWTCKMCKKLFSDKDGKTEITKPVVIPKTGHNWGDWKTTKEPTETATGEKQRVCKNDSFHVEKETIPIKKSESTPTSETETQAKNEVKNVSGIPLAKMIAKGKKSLKITWMKVNGAEGYDIFFAACGQNEKKTKCKLVKTVTGNSKFSWTKTKLKAKKAYKAYVKAWVMENGNKKYVGTSPLVHAFTANGTKTQTNAKNVKVEKTKISVKKGKTKKIKVVSIAKVKSKLELMDKSHAAKLRYLSTDKKIATVNKSGKIKGISKGSCYVYVYAHNGVSRRITVKVN